MQYVKRDKWAAKTLAERCALPLAEAEKAVKAFADLGVGANPKRPAACVRWTVDGQPWYFWLDSESILATCDEDEQRALAHLVVHRIEFL